MRSTSWLMLGVAVQVMVWGTGAGKKIQPTPSLPTLAATALPTPAAAVTPAALSESPDAMALIRAQQAIADLTADFTLTMEAATPDQASFQAAGQVWMASGRRYCVHYVSPERQRLVSNGQRRWLYLEKINQVQIQNLPPAGDPQDLFLELGGGLPTLIGRCQVQRVKSGDEVIYDLIPQPGTDLQFTRARVWLQGELWLPKKIEVTAARRITAVFHRVKIHTTDELLRHPERGVPDSQFTFIPPKDAEIVELFWKNY